MPMESMIPYGKQDINDDDLAAVVNVLKSDFLTQGPKVPEFEQAISDKCKVKHAVAVNSATSALHIANLALGVGKGDIVWTSPITFVATANSAIYCGASVDFVDIDLTSGNLCTTALEQKLIKAKQTNNLPKVVIPVHLAGQSCDMEKIYQLSQQYNFRIIEDASHAIGASYQKMPVGSCKYSDITVFSFHPVKIITSAEGGIAATNNAGLAEKMQSLRSHGITTNSENMTEQSHGPWYYQQTELGFNYRMTDLQAALGISQLTRLSNFIDKRNQLAHVYDEAFEQTEITSLKAQTDCYSSYHLYLILLPKNKATQQKYIIETLREKNIFAHVHYIPVHTQPYYQDLGFKIGDFPNAEQYYQRVISLPLYPQLTEEQQAYIIEQVIGLVSE